MFPTRVPVSEFTAQAFEGHIKELESLTFFSKTDLYAIAAGERPDHLLYGRELHRALCVCNPESASEYRALLESDAALAVTKGRRAETPDTHKLSKLSAGLTDAIIRELQGDKTGEGVESAARRLHAALSVFLSQGRVEQLKPRDVRSELSNAG